MKMDFGTTLIAIVATVAGFGVPVIIVGIVYWYKSRQSRLLHETAIRLAEKGQAVPPELFLGRVEPDRDLRQGVILIALGLGLCIALGQLGVTWTFGLIPLLMGVGYVLVWKLSANTASGGQAPS
jgi:hypothetical protein